MHWPSFSCLYCTVRIGLIFILCAISGSLVAALFLNDRPSVASSAALFGLLGAMLSGLIRNWKFYTKKVIIPWSLSLLDSSPLWNVQLINRLFIPDVLMCCTLLTRTTHQCVYYDYPVNLKPVRISFSEKICYIHGYKHVVLWSNDDVVPMWNFTIG